MDTVLSTLHTEDIKVLEEISLGPDLLKLKLSSVPDPEKVTNLFCASGSPSVMEA